MKLRLEKRVERVEYAIHSEEKSNIAVIHFRDGDIDRVEFFAKNPYTRDDWKMMAFIDKQISILERRHT